jgi:hypothetical protein
MYVYSHPMSGIFSCHTTQHTTQIPPSNIPLPPSTHIRNNDNDDGSDGDTEGGDCSNGAIFGQRYGQPHDQHPAHGPGVVHVEASAGICAGVQLQTMMGWEGEGGGGGSTTGSASSTTTTMTMNTTTMTNTTARRMGMGCTGERTMGGGSDYNSCDVIPGPSFGGVGQ